MIIHADTLVLTKIDIEGESKNIFGLTFKRIAKEIAEAFCKKYGTRKLNASGAIRTTGKTKGKYLNIMKFEF